ncbi:hypothetical protein DXP75_06920 [Listeria monocytogenes]|nr:hypothetical protein [Listeria monocytogenes]
MNESREKQLLRALESIAKSLSVLAEDTKTRQRTRDEILKNVEGMESELHSLKNDPFNFFKRTE